MSFRTKNISSFFDPKKLVGKVLDGRYEIREYIDRGGMGLVYKVYDRDLDKIRAIKVPPPEIIINPLAESRLRKETRRASDLSHENIIKVFNFEVSRSPSETKGLPFILMEFIDGKSLDFILSDREGQKLQEKKALKIMLQVAEALHYAHEKGVIHLDLKPQNIMIDKDGKVKVLDFGIAREIRTSISRTSGTGYQSTAGTLPYMSPEQVSKRFGRPDERTDIWGFGATLYHLVAGEPPFETERQIMEDDLLWEGIEVSDDVKALIEKCMEKRKEDRFQNFEEVVKFIEKLLEGGNVTLGPSPGEPIDTNLLKKMKNWSQEKKNEEFLAAIRTKNLERANTLLKAGAEVDCKDEEGNTALHYAASSGQLEFVELLIKNGIDPDLINNKIETALHKASEKGYADIIKFLINHGAAPNAKNKKGETPLHYATHKGKVDVIKTLIELGADPNSKRKNGNTPLHTAASIGDVKAIKVLIELGADPNANAQKGWTPLHEAASNGQAEAIKVLVKLGADPNTKGKSLFNKLGNSPLHVAAFKGKVEAVKALLELGADPNIKNKLGLTPSAFTYNPEVRAILERYA